MAWRYPDVESLLAAGPLPTRPSLEYISRLPIMVGREDPIPLPMDQVAKLIPGYCPWEAAESGAPGVYVFDAEKARNSIEFFHTCIRHVSGELGGQPFILELWQQAILANVYGWVRKDNGLRRFVEVFELEPRKQGKTAKIGGVVCYMLFADGEMGAQVYSAASEREQAALVYLQASGMVIQEPMMDERGSCHKSLKTIEYHATGSFYRAISAEAGTKHGFNASCWIMDELHAQKGRELIDVLDSSTGSRRQPLGWIITTRDFDGPTICNSKMDYAMKVRDGVVDDVQYLPVLYLIEDPKADWQAEETWRQSNPNYGVSVKPGTMKRDCEKAANEGPAAVATFKRLRLNMKTSQAVSLVDGDLLDKSQLTGDQVPSEKKLKESPCFGALDLASTSDLIAFGLWWPELSFFRVWTWVPGITASRRMETDRVPYLRWTDDPLARMKITEGNVADLDLIESGILALCETYKPASVAYDRWNAAQMVNHMTETGITMTAFGQGFASMSNPTKELLRLIGQEKAGHEANPVLRWACSNTVGKTDEAGNVKPDKKRSRDKIDPLVVWVMAVGESMTAGKRKKSAYRNRGMRRL